MPCLHSCKKLLPLIVLVLLAGSSCKKKNDVPPPTPSSDKILTNFVLKQADNTAYLDADITGVIANDSIQLEVPAETDITSLKPAIVFTGKSVSPASGAAQNFSSPVTYTVTAADGSTKKYVAIVHYRSTVFITSLDGALYAFDAANGQQIWRFNNGQFDTGTPSVYNGTVYCNARDGLYAVDARNGTQRWRFAIPASQSGGAPVTNSQVVNGNTVYIGAFDGFMYALNTADGSLKWKTKSTGGQPFVSSVTFNNNMVYAGCADSLLYAFNAASGAVLWKTLTGRPVYTNPLIINNNVCVEGFASKWYLLNGATGAVIWSVAGSDNISSPVYDNGRIYSGGGNRGFAHDPASGTQVWSFLYTPGGMIYNERSGPVISDGKFYAGSNDGTFYAMDIATKTRVWTYQTWVINGGYIYSSPVLNAGILYFGNNNGSLFALNATNGALVWQKPTGNGVFGSACVVDRAGQKHYPAVSGEQN